MSPDVKHFLTLVATVTALTLGALSGLAYGSDDCTCPRAFSWERGPIRREIARVANSQKEEEEDFERRIHRYAWAVSDASDRYHQKSSLTKVQLRALLLTIGKHESHWDERVCEDFTENAPGAPAFGCWQSEGEPPESVEEAAFRAAYDLTRAFRYCAKEDDPIRGAISLYATGETCDWEGADERMQSYRQIYGRLQ